MLRTGHGVTEVRQEVLGCGVFTTAPGSHTRCVSRLHKSSLLSSLEFVFTTIAFPLLNSSPVHQIAAAQPVPSPTLQSGASPGCARSVGTDLVLLPTVALTARLPPCSWPPPPGSWTLEL